MTAFTPYCLGYFIRNLRIRVENRRELDSWKTGINPRMVFADAADSDDSCSNVDCS